MKSLTDFKLNLIDSCACQDFMEVKTCYSLEMNVLRYVTDRGDRDGIVWCSVSAIWLFPLKKCSLLTDPSGWLMIDQTELWDQFMDLKDLVEIRLIIRSDWKCKKWVTSLKSNSYHETFTDFKCEELISKVINRKNKLSLSTEIIYGIM